MSSVILLFTLAASYPSPAQESESDRWTDRDPGWWVRDYTHYQEGEGYSSYSVSAWNRGTGFMVRMSPIPEPPPEDPPTFRDAVRGAGFGLVLLLMIVVPVGSTILFLRPRGVTWCRGSTRISRAEAREMLGRL